MKFKWDSIENQTSVAMIETSFSLLIHTHPIILIPPAKKHFLELIICKNRALCHPAKSQTALTKIDLERVQSWPVPFKTKHCWLKPTEHCRMKPQQESLNLNPVKNCGFGNPHHICKIRFEPQNIIGFKLFQPITCLRMACARSWQRTRMLGK